MFHSSSINSTGAWVAQSVKCLPLAHVMISRSWDRAPRGAPSSGSLLLPLPLLLPPAHSLVATPGARPHVRCVTLCASPRRGVSMQTSRMSLELELDTNYSGRCAGHRSAGEPDIISLMCHVGGEEGPRLPPLLTYCTIRASPGFFTVPGTSCIRRHTWDGNGHLITWTKLGI